ncbi:MAG TPA: DUF3859 domain-containing protein [Spirochaetia bacterium]|nr:DUF3859 domain-containing protein [Spirochaetales bacterium]HRY81417.1 DUF3859 domain-containing protein [Spirochaetia bacterium]HRZ89474.1 DUF3859 domain-containing protein [Spirochaetia bacterium]
MKNLVWFFFGVLVLSSCVTTVNQEKVDPVSISILEKGLYTSDIIRTEKTPTDVYHVTENHKLLEETALVPLKKGVLFGFKLKLESDKYKELEVEIRLIHPSFYDPYLKKESSSSISKMKIYKEKTRFRGYLLEEDFELAPGKWIYEIWYKGKLYATTEFELKN